MIGILTALLSGALMSVQGVFNTQVTKATSLWVSTSFVQFTAFLVCLYLSDGASYGNAGRTFLRMNVATPYANVVDGTARLIKGIKLYLDENKGKN